MITSSSNPRVKQVIQWQTKAKERRNANIFLIEGTKLFEEVPTEDVQEIYVAEGALKKILEQPVLQEKLQNIGFEVVSDEIFSKMSDTQTPQGILCVVKRPTYSIDQMLAKNAPLLMVLENLQDPGNLGTIVRTGEGAGITGVIMSKQTVDIYNPKTIRATMGSIFRVPILYVEDLEATIQLLHERGIHTYAAHLEGERYYDSFSFCEGTAFLIGNEGNGLTREIADAAESYIKIPMEGKVESLNAAIASSLLMYEAHRQRAMAGK